MYHPRLRGNHYDMGHHYGALLHKNGFRVSQLPQVDEQYRSFITSSEAVVNEVYPEICQEVRGFAEGCEADYLELMGFLLTIGVSQPAPHCSCFAAQTDSGVIFGRNHDYFKQTKAFTESSLIVPDGFHAFVGQGDTFVGREDGVNVRGLAVGYTFVYSQAVQPGINFLLVIRGLLERCQTVSEAITWLESLPLSTTQNFVLADASGDMAVVEATPGQIVVRRPEEGTSFVVATNNFQTPSMRSRQHNEDRNWYQAETRYDGICQVLAGQADNLTLTDAQDVLAGKYGFVCQYNPRGDFDTLWSVVANLDTLELTRAEGNPKRTRYKEDKRLARVHPCK
ncbi:MAG: C45 family peptidase [Deinococcota bacterium]